MSPSQLAFVQKRRSTRIYNAIPLAIHGSDAFRAPYTEQVSTITVNCHGCRYQSKYEVIPGDVVYLEVRHSGEGSPAYSRPARISWVLRILNKDPRFEIAVELLAPANIWGIVSPPDDWLPNQAAKAIEMETTPREQPPAPLIEKQAPPALNVESARASRVLRDDPAAALSPAISQMMSGFGKQIQTMVSHAATAAFVKERDRLLEEFRGQLQSEATKTLERAISTTKEELTRRALQDLNDAYEAAARSTYERWNTQIKKDMQDAEQSIAAQAKEVSRRVAGMSVSTIERLQRNMEASRTEAVERFLSRLREQVAPLLENAEVTIQNLTTSEKKLKDGSQAIFDRFNNLLQQAAHDSIAEVQEKTVGMLAQFESDVAKRLAESHEGLQETSAEVMRETARIVGELSQGCEETVQIQLQSLVSSAASDVTKVLTERSAQISNHFTNQLEDNTRSYLELINKSVAEIPKETVAQSGD